MVSGKEMVMDYIAQARRWLNTAERSDLSEATVPALIGIGNALLAIAEKMEAGNAGR